MNEVISLADDKVYYQDTDSLHILEDDIKKLSVDFKDKYDWDLIGKGMGQFHSDFASSKLTGIFKAIPGNDEKDPNIYSKRFISLGKKCYVDVLEIKESKEVDYHIRMKGIPIDSIKAFCAEK